MNQLEQYLSRDIPLDEAAAFFVDLKKFGAATDPPDETGALEGTFLVPIEQALMLMQRLVKKEFETAYAYHVYSQSVRDMSHDALSGHFLEHAADELGHADFLMKRMAVLGGPVMVPELEAPHASANPVDIVKTLIRMEQEAIAGWRQLIAVVGENPMKVTIEDYAAKEQEHLDDLWQLLPDELKAGLAPGQAGQPGGMPPMADAGPGAGAPVPGSEPMGAPPGAPGAPGAPGDLEEPAPEPGLEAPVLDNAMPSPAPKEQKKEPPKEKTEEKKPEEKQASVLDKGRALASHVSEAVGGAAKAFKTARSADKEIVQARKLDPYDFKGLVTQVKDKYKTKKSSVNETILSMRMGAEATKLAGRLSQLASLGENAVGSIYGPEAALQIEEQKKQLLNDQIRQVLGLESPREKTAKSDKTDAELKETGRQRGVSAVTAEKERDKGRRGERAGKLMGTIGGAGAGAAAGQKLIKGGLLKGNKTGLLAGLASGALVGHEAGKEVGKEVDIHRHGWKKLSEKDKTSAVISMRMSMAKLALDEMGGQPGGTASMAAPSGATPPGAAVPGQMPPEMVAAGAGTPQAPPPPEEPTGAPTGIGPQLQPTNYLEAEQMGQQAQNANESAFYRTQLNQAQQSGAAAQQQLADLQVQMQQLQDQAAQATQNIQMATTQATMAQDEATRQAMEAAKARIGAQQMRAQILETVSQDPQALGEAAVNPPPPAVPGMEGQPGQPGTEGQPSTEAGGAPGDGGAPDAGIEPPTAPEGPAGGAPSPQVPPGAPSPAVGGGNASAGPAPGPDPNQAQPGGNLKLGSLNPAALGIDADAAKFFTQVLGG